MMSSSYYSQYSNQQHRGSSGYNPQHKYSNNPIPRVGAESVASIVTFVDGRANTLNSSVDTWYAAKTDKLPEDSAFLATFKKWFVEWQGFRNLFSALPFEAQKEEARSKAEEYQKSVFLWESRFEQQKLPLSKRSGAVLPAEPSSTAGVVGKTLLVVGAVGTAGYFVYKYLLPKYY